MSKSKQGKEIQSLHAKNGPDILVDAGPLLALIAGDDPNHAACVNIVRQLDKSFITTLPAFSHAVTVASDQLGQPAVDALWKMIFDELVIIENLQMQDYQRIAKLLRKHDGSQIDLADASLLAVAERLGLSSIFTLNQAEFKAYKSAGKKALTVIGP